MALSDIDHLFLNASQVGEVDEVIKTLDAGANIHVSNDSALRMAAKNGHTKTVGLLLDRGADIHANGTEIFVNANDALCLAAGNGHKETVELLLDRGANIHAENDLAFRWTACNGLTEIVAQLLDHGSDIHALGDDALYWAIKNGHSNKDTVLLLLRRGADSTAKGSESKGAFERAKLAEFLSELKQETLGHFKSGQPSQEQCFSTDAKGIPRLHGRVLDACMIGQFTALIGAPLIASTDKSDRQLFHDIWDALPQHWQDQNHNIYMQFLKEGGVNPIIGSHTAVTHRNTLLPDKLAGR